MGLRIGRVKYCWFSATEVWNFPRTWRSWKMMLQIPLAVLWGNGSYIWTTPQKKLAKQYRKQDNEIRKIATRNRLQ